MQEVHKWKSKSEYYDIENGEQISKKLALRDYAKIRTRKEIKIENHEGQINYIHECRKQPQLKLW